MPAENMKLYLDIEDDYKQNKIFHWDNSNPSHAYLALKDVRHYTNETYHFNFTQVGYNWHIKNDMAISFVVTNGTHQFDTVVSAGGGSKILHYSGLVEMIFNSQVNTKQKQERYVLLNTTDPENQDYSGLQTVIEAAAVAFSGHLRFEKFKSLLEEDLEDLIGLRVNGTETDLEDIEDDVPFEEMHRSYRCFISTENIF